MELGRIYVLKNPISRRIVYVGQTINSLDVRLKGHYSDALSNKSRLVCTWIKSLFDRGLEPIIEEVCQCDIKDLDKLEKFYIQRYRDLGVELLNLTNGGSGNFIKESNNIKKQNKKRKIERLSKKGILLVNSDYTYTIIKNQNMVNEYIALKEIDLDFSKLESKKSIIMYNTEQNKVSLEVLRLMSTKLDTK